MKTTVLATIVLLFSALCVGQDRPITLKDIPDFKREYKVHLGINGVVLTVTAKRNDYSWRDDDKRDFEAELTQPDGRWVVFDIDRPAEKVLDRDLLPILLPLCKKIKAMDRKFMAEGPKEITDSYGHQWVRVK